MPEPITLEVFTDYVCPWCYLGDHRVKQIKHSFDVRIQLVHFPLHPETPSKGRSLQDLFQCGPDEIKVKNVRMQGLMAAEGLPFRDRTHTYNSRLAQEIGTWAETQLGGSAIHDKFFEAYFVHGRDVGDVAVIVDVVKSVGLDEQTARDVLTERRFEAAVDADWDKSRRYGVTGVPTYVSNGQGLVGAQSYEALYQFMVGNGAKPRAD